MGRPFVFSGEMSGPAGGRSTPGPLGNVHKKEREHLCIFTIIERTIDSIFLLKLNGDRR